MMILPLYSEIIEACILLDLDTADKSESEIRILFWKTMYERTVDQIGQVQKALARLMTNEPRTPGSLLQCEADAELLVTHSLREGPFDLLTQLRRNQRTADK